MVDVEDPVRTHVQPGTPSGAGRGADRGEKPAGRYGQAVADFSSRSGHDAGGGAPMSFPVRHPVKI